MNSTVSFSNQHEGLAVDRANFRKVLNESLSRMFESSTKKFISDHFECFIVKSFAFTRAEAMQLRKKGSRIVPRTKNPTSFEFCKVFSTKSLASLLGWVTGCRGRTELLHDNAGFLRTWSSLQFVEENKEILLWKIRKQMKSCKALEHNSMPSFLGFLAKAALRLMSDSGQMFN